MIQQEEARRNSDVEAADRIALNFFLVGLSPSISGRPIQNALSLLRRVRRRPVSKDYVRTVLEFVLIKPLFFNRRGSADCGPIQPPADMCTIWGPLEDGSIAKIGF